MKNHKSLVWFTFGIVVFVALLAVSHYGSTYDAHGLTGAVLVGAILIRLRKK